MKTTIITRSILGLFLALTFVAAPVWAEQQVASAIAQGRPRGAYSPTVVTASRRDPPAGLRKAQAGSVNIIAMVGNAADGINEQRYARAQADSMGGFFFHGGYGLEDLVSWIVACGQRGTQIDSIVFIGHMNELQSDPLAEVLRGRDAAWAPIVRKRNREGVMENRVGFVHPGYNGGDNPSIDRMANWNRDAFVGRLETALRERNVRPDQVFTNRCRVVFRVCETGTFSRRFLDELATLIPVGGEVVGYDVPYVWNFTQYPLGITTYRPDPEQTNGRFTIPGSYRRPAPAPAPAPAPEAPQANAGPGAAPADGPGAGPGAFAGAAGEGQPTGLLGVAMTPQSAPAATPEVAPGAAEEPTDSDGPVLTALPQGVDSAVLDAGITAAQQERPDDIEQVTRSLNAADAATGN